MADDNSQLPAVRQERQLVADTIPIFDTARFEHYGRIASVMARSEIVPESLRKGDGVANCFQVVELADRWGYSPFAVAQCASVVYGKLMLEGKLVSAVLESKLGVELHHYYQGEWGTDAYRIYVTDHELDESQIERLRPHIKIPNVKMVDGSVGEWKTFEKDGKTTKGNWLKQPDVQLQYRGDRTWARLFKSALMLGVLTDDEMDSFEDRRLEAPAAQPALTAGPPKPSRSPRTAEGAPAARQTDEPEERLHASQEAAADAEFEDGVPTDGDEAAKPSEEGEKIDTTEEDRPTSPAEPTATEPAQAAEPEPDSPASATDASTDTAAETSSPGAPEKPSDAGPKPTPATDEVYLIAGDEFDADGKRPTYKNGQPWSRIGEKAAAKLKEYEVHHPGAPDEEDDDADAEGLEEASRAQDRVESEEVGGPIDVLNAIAAAKSYLGAKQALKFDGYKELAPEVKTSLQKAVWDRYVELGDETAPQEDYLLMWLFLKHGATRYADIQARWPSFWRGQAYKMASEDQKRAITELHMKQKEEMAP